MSDRSTLLPPESPPFDDREPPSPPESDGDHGDDGGHGLVRVAIAANQSEAEFLQQILASEGIPSMLTRSRGFDVPDFLAAGPRDILVDRRQELDAREALLQTGHLDNSAEITGPDPLRLLAALLLVVGVVAVVLWIGFG